MSCWLVSTWYVLDVFLRSASLSLGSTLVVAMLPNHPVAAACAGFIVNVRGSRCQVFGGRKSYLFAGYALLLSTRNIICRPARCRRVFPETGDLFLCES